MGVKAATRFSPCRLALLSIVLLIVLFVVCQFADCAVTGTNFCYDSAIWAQTAATHKTASTNEWVGGLLLQSLSYTAVYLSPSERIRTLVLILTERST